MAPRWQFEASDEYESSVEEALRKVTGPPERVAINLKARIEKLQDLTLEDLNKRSEGSITCLDGTKKKFFAIAYRDRVRIYVVPAKNDALFFSHAIFKKAAEIESDGHR